MTVRRLVALAAALLVAREVRADEAPRTLCFTAAPLPHCQSFLVTELGLMARILYRSRLDQESTPNDILLVHFEAGWMRNLSSRYALGAAAYAGFDEDGHRLGFKLRGRRWLTPDVTLDLGAGLILETDDRPEIEPGFIAHVALGYRERIAIVTQLEAIPYAGQLDNPLREVKGTEVSWHIGIKVGGRVGLVVAAAGTVGVILLLAAVMDPAD